MREVEFDGKPPYLRTRKSSLPTVVSADFSQGSQPPCDPAFLCGSTPDALEEFFPAGIPHPSPSPPGPGLHPKLWVGQAENPA